MEIASIHNTLTDGWTNLHVAAWSGNLQEVKSLVRKGRNILAQTQDIQGDLAIMTALSSNQLDVAVWFLENGVNPECKNNYDGTPLHYAASCGHTKFVERLIRMDVDINAKMNRLDGRTALHEAAKEGHEDVVKLLIACGANTNQVDTVYNHTALHWAALKGKFECLKLLVNRTKTDDTSINRPIHLAATYGHADIVELLLEKGENVDVTNKNGNTSLHLASFHGHYNVCKNLLHRGANVHVQDQTLGRTPAHCAAIGGHKEVLKLLAEWKADLYAFSTVTGCTPLHYAARENHSDCCKVIYSTKGELEVAVKNKKSCLPIHMATAHGSTNVVAWLISEGASVNKRNGMGITPLHAAVKMGHLFLVRYLIRRTADVNAKILDGTDRTPLHLAAEVGNTAIAKLLIEEGAKVSPLTFPHNWTPAHYAAWHGRLELFKLLVLNRADVRVLCTKDTGERPLHLAIRAGHQNIVEYLLNGIVLPDSTTAKGRTALQLAAYTSNETAAKLLLKKGASANRRSKKGDGLTALHYAVRKNNVAIARMLLEAGADIKAVAMGRMPIHCAAANGREECMNLLVKHGASLTEPTCTIHGHTPLHLASKFGQLDAACWLLEKGVPINIKDHLGLTPLYYALNNIDLLQILLFFQPNVNFIAPDNITPLYHAVSVANNVDSVRLLMNQGAKQNIFCGPQLETPMHLAARTGKFEFLKILVSFGGDVNIQTKNKNEDTPIFLAVQNGQLEIVEWLLDKGVDLDRKNKLGMSLLHVAAYYGHYDISKILLDRGANVYERAHGYKECTGLHCAALRGHPSLIRLLYSYGADINALSSVGQTPAHWAASSNNVSCLEELAKYEVVDFNIQDKMGNSLVFTAVQNSSQQAVRWLVNKGLDVNILNHSKCTPLHIAACNGNFEIAQLLLEKRANVNAVDQRGRTPVHLSILNNHHKVLRLLLDRKPDLSICTPEILQPLHYAAFTGRWECLDILATTKADLMLPANNTTGDQPIHIAAKAGQVITAIYLLDHGVPVDILNRNGDTPLCLAAREGHFHMVAMLLERGARINETGDKKGRTALHIASSKGHLQIVKLLLENGGAVNFMATISFETPLHCAVKNDRLLVVRALVSAGAAINWPDAEGMTPLELADSVNHRGILHYLTSLNLNGIPIN